MFNTIYIEESVRDHPRTIDILKRFKGREIIDCRHYGEVFNVKSQNFRLQKKQPALILAEKQGRTVLEAPDGYGIGAQHNYYFSHLLNCVYDCRYCFLQGMYQSAHSVLFVNYETFIEDIRTTASQHSDDPVHFFSGYDGDSLAIEPVTTFAETFINELRDIPNVWLELRTKSTQIRQLLSIKPWSQCIVAFSFTPEDISRATEHGVPSIAQRLNAIEKLQRQGWQIGIRLDPLIDCSDFNSQYEQLLQKLFDTISPDHLHSISFGPFRMPEKFFSRMVKLYPAEKLFAANLEKNNAMYSYAPDRELEMRNTVESLLLQYTGSDKLFPCISS